MIKKQRRFPKPRPEGAPAGPRVSWAGFREMHDYWGKKFPRYYQLETLSSAVEYALQTRDLFIGPAVHDVLGPTPLVSLRFELFQEGRFQLIFRVLAVNALKRRAEFAFVAAKNAKDCSEIARTEHRLLGELHRRAPMDIAKPYRGGTIYLPDRYGRKNMGREVYCYLTQWLNGYDELGIHKNLQLLVNVKPHHLFSRTETEALKGQMVEIVAKTYSREDFSCMTLPEIASGDFVVHRAPRGVLRLKLIACRKIQPRMRPGKLIDQMLDAAWDWGGQRYRFAPELPETFVTALENARGKDEAHAWLLDYLEGIRAGRYPKRKPEFLEELRALVVK